MVDRRQRLESNPKCWTRILSSNWTEKDSTQKLIYITSNYSYSGSRLVLFLRILLAIYQEAFAHRDRRKPYKNVSHGCCGRCQPMIRWLARTLSIIVVFLLNLVPRMYLECTISLSSYPQRLSAILILAP